MDSSDFKIKCLTSNDIDLFKELIELFISVFEEEDASLPDQNYLEGLLKKTDFLVFVAMNNKQIVGGLTAFELPKYYSKSSELFIYDIAVKPGHQRKGLGKMLLEHTIKYCQEKGINEIFVAANEEDQHALDFYHATGGEAEKVVHFNYML
ncbi:MAG: N-acetyltransferase family protein [Bacteroidia bacterium]